MPDVYKRPAAFCLVKGSSGDVKKLVFLVYYSQYPIQSGDYRRSAYTDLMWNAASSFVEVDVARYDAYVCRTGTDNRYPSLPKKPKKKPGKAPIDPATLPNKQRRIGGKAKDFTHDINHTIRSYLIHYIDYRLLNKEYRRSPLFIRCFP